MASDPRETISSHRPISEKHVQDDTGSKRMTVSSFENDPFDLDESWKKRAQIEVNEGDESRNNLQTLRNKLVKVDNLRPRTDDNFLSGFLRVRKHNVEEAFDMIMRYYDVRKKYPQFFKTCFPNEHKFAYDVQVHTILNNRDHKGRAILIGTPGNMDPEIVTAEHIVGCGMTSLQVLVEDPKVQIAGMIIISDLTGFTFYKQTKLLTPTSMKIIFNNIQDNFPLRVRELHVVNEPWYFDALFAIVRPFLKEKLRKRIFIHGKDMSSLHQHIPASVLPENYGGTLPPINPDNMVDQIRKYSDKLREWQQFGYRE